MTLSNTPGSWYRSTKRALDLVLASAALLVLSPALSVIAILVRMSSPGPALFRQKRLGVNGTVFTIFKFRTMVLHEASSLAEKVVHSADPRITRLGKILRDFRLDELPQLFNVIRGEMSIVGPRPLTPDFYPYYTDRDKQRLLLRPGITGWQQVNGASQHSWTQRIALDVWYVENASIWLDLKIMWRTAGVALTREGVYASDGSQLSGVPDALRTTLRQGFDNECNRNSSAPR
jgi:lipopolysaccharide/colanic/teichoic acid biosynthesis glycosyltransferase